MTIIFLPLSTIAGILGMNTNDVRNMQSNQWLFWVLAIPLSVVTIGACLLWTGEMTRLSSRLKEQFTGKKSGRQVQNESSRSRAAEQFSAIRSNGRPPSSPEDFIQPVSPFGGVPIPSYPLAYPMEPSVSLTGMPPRDSTMAMRTLGVCR